MPVNSAPAASPKTTNLFLREWLQLIDQHIDTDMDAGAHAVGSTEFGHPHEKNDAQFLRPAEVERQQPVLHARDAVPGWRSDA
jgi:hypothetical protein